MTLVLALAAIGFGKLDAIAFYPIDGADVNAVRADDFHVFFDIRHFAVLSVRSITSRRCFGSGKPDQSGHQQEPSHPVLC
jgi:hypothetical protein